MVQTVAPPRRRRVPPRALLTYSKLGGLVEKPPRRGAKPNASVAFGFATAAVVRCPELVAHVLGASTPRTRCAHTYPPRAGWLRHDEVEVAGAASREWTAWAASRSRCASRLLVATPSRVSLLQTWAASANEELASHRSVAPLGRAAFRARRKPRHWCSSLCLGPWDAGHASRAVYVANWEGDAILEYALGLDNDLRFVKVLCADARLRHPEGVAFWKGRLRVCASYHSAVVAVTRSGRVDAARTVHLRTTEWCWGLAVDPKSDRLLVSASPPYDFQADLPGDAAHVARHGEILEVDETLLDKRGADGRRKAAHGVRVVATALTRPGGMAFAPRTHAHAGDLFVTEYGVGGAGRVVRFSRDGPAGTFSPNTYVDLGALLSEPERRGLPADLVNPWSLTFAAGGDALYVATDPNHRAVLHLDGAGNFVKTLERRGEAPNFVLCA